jgi:hypothetical protein
MPKLPRVYAHQAMIKQPEMNAMYSGMNGKLGTVIA